MAEKHTRTVVPVVLAIAGADSDTSVSVEHLSTRQLQTRTTSFLELLAKFVNPKAAFRSAELHTLYLTLLSKGETKVQGVALKCLLTYKSPNLTPYGERLRDLLDESKFRDELAHLELGTDSNVVEPQHRPEFLDVVIRVLYGIMMSRRARSSTAQGQGARKQAVLTSLSGVAPEELKTLVDHMLEPFGGLEQVDPAALDDIELASAGRQQLGFLSFLADVLKYLAPQTTLYWPRLLGATLVLVRQAQEAIDAEGSTEKADKAEDAEDEVAEETEEEDNENRAAPLRSIRSTVSRSRTPRPRAVHSTLSRLFPCRPTRPLPL
jgi:U3 small nucleolar RNA-associated protein 20